MRVVYDPRIPDEAARWLAGADPREHQPRQSVAVTDRDSKRSAGPLARHARPPYVRESRRRPAHGPQTTDQAQTSHRRTP